jgi:hypothetical protein
LLIGDCRLALTPGSRIGPYEIVDAIGAGGMGEVYRARDAKLASDVAINLVLNWFEELKQKLP